MSILGDLGTAAVCAAFAIAIANSQNEPMQPTQIGPPLTPITRTPTQPPFPPSSIDIPELSPPADTSQPCIEVEWDCPGNHEYSGPTSVPMYVPPAPKLTFTPAHPGEMMV